jgi:hypothetical protein
MATACGSAVKFDRQETRGGEDFDSIDPDLKLAYIREITARVEREAPAGLGIGTGVTWRGERQHGARQRAYWPFEAFSVPVTLDDPGPDAESGPGMTAHSFSSSS